MISKQQVEKLVLDKDYAKIIKLARHDAKKIFRYLMRLTYTTDELLRHRAIEAIGLVSAELSETDSELVLDVIRRIIWSMCDESGAQSWSAAETIAEIIYHKPALYGEFGPIMINASLDEVIFQKGMLWAVGRLQNRITYTKEILPEIINFLEHPQPILRGYAAWALGELKAKQAVNKLALLNTDAHPVAIYINGEMHIKTVGNWAMHSVAKIS